MGNRQGDSDRRFDQWQYDFLKQCSEKGEEGIKEWNEWREKNPETDILLEGAILTDRFLRAIRLDTKTTIPLRGHVHLERAQLQRSDLAGAWLCQSHLEESHFNEANLDGAKVQNAFTQGTVFHLASLQQANVSKMITDSATSLWEAKIDRKTDARGVPLDALRIDAATRQLLERNARQQNWEEWYKKHRRYKWLVKLFWWMSDYGLSTGGIVKTFFVLALAFAAVYYFAACADPPGIVNSLLEGDEGSVPSWLLPVRAIYFSVVTMTTLGFGDMHANCQSLWGHILLTLQVLLGYVLLGALVTRFAVLFTAGGPAGRFAEGKSVISDK